MENSASIPDRCAETARTRLDAASTAPALARRFAREVLAGRTVDGELLERAELLVSELVTNAVVHGGTAAWLSVSTAHGVVYIEVEDGGGGRVARRKPGDPHRKGAGLGLWLVDSLADSWGVEQGRSNTKRVWLNLAPRGTQMIRLAG